MPPEKATPIGSGFVTALRRCRAATSRFRRRARRCTVGRCRRDRRAACRALGREEARVGRIRIRTADEREIDHVMRRHHARVARMKLTRPGRRRSSAWCSVSMRSATYSAGPSCRLARKYRIGRSIDRARRTVMPLAADQRERSVDGANRRRIALSTRRRASSTSMFEMRFRSGSRRSTTRLTGWDMVEPWLIW